MNAQITCQQCGQVIAEGETVFAVKVKQTVHPLCQTCSDAFMPERQRIPRGLFTTKTTTSTHLVKVYRSVLTGGEKNQPLATGEPFFAIRIDYVKENLSNISFNGHEA